MPVKTPYIACPNAVKPELKQYSNASSLLSFKGAYRYIDELGWIEMMKPLPDEEPELLTEEQEIEPIEEVEIKPLQDGPIEPLEREEERKLHEIVSAGRKARNIVIGVETTKIIDKSASAKTIKNEEAVNAAENYTMGLRAEELLRNVVPSGMDKVMEMAAVGTNSGNIAKKILELSGHKSWSSFINQLDFKKQEFVQKLIKERTYFQTNNSTPVVSYKEVVRDLAGMLKKSLKAEKIIEGAEKYKNANLDELKIAVEKMEEAEEKLAVAYDHLIPKIANSFSSKGLLSFEDACQLGRIGNRNAIKTFDRTMGHDFKEYLRKGIINSISNALNSENENINRVVRIPKWVIEQRSVLDKADKKFLKELGRQATPEELEDRTGIPVEKQDELRKFGKETSLSAEVNDGDSTLDYFIADDEEKSTEEVAIDREYDAKVTEFISRVMKNFTDKERNIVNKRHGITDPKGQENTLQQIADEYGQTREAIRVAEKKAMNKIKTTVEENSEEPLFTDVRRMYLEA